MQLMISVERGISNSSFLKDFSIKEFFLLVYLNMTDKLKGVKTAALKTENI